MDTDDRLLITRIQPAKTQAGGDVIHLFSQRLQYPVLYLFELADLADVDIDHTSLDPSKETACKFWAYYKLGKENSEGKPYKDLLYLKPLAPLTTPATTPTPILAAMAIVTNELRAIKAILQRLTLPTSSSQALTTTSDNTLAGELFGGQTTKEQDRDRFYSLVATGLSAEVVNQDDVDGILNQLDALDWKVTADCLQAEIARRKTLTPQKLRHHHNIIARLLTMQQSSKVAATAKAAGLSPGWQWLLNTDELLTAGLTIKESIEVPG